ncbi:phage tail protein [Pseudomonas koreensis]|uniref:phage tail protein n=1 Tax=Pseudomonas koreensis TaxID=198620 RepID=UPI003F83F67C
MNAVFQPAVAHRFLATFTFSHNPSPLDVHFQSVSGLGRDMSVNSVRQGGDNVGAINLPTGVEHGRLTLQRGVMTITPLSVMFNQAMNEFKPRYVDVLIMLLNGAGVPTCGWAFRDAQPVKYDTASLDASSNTVLINTFELAYREMHMLGVQA